jgi:hypothetical protein
MTTPTVRNSASVEIEKPFKTGFMFGLGVFLAGSIFSVVSGVVLALAMIGLISSAANQLPSQKLNELPSRRLNQEYNQDYNQEYNQEYNQDYNQEYNEFID